MLIQFNHKQHFLSNLKTHGGGNYRHFDTKNENTEHYTHDNIGKLLHLIYLTQFYNRQRANLVKFF